MKKRIFIVIPAYNAEDTLEDVLKRIPDEFKNKDRVIVVDDASTDRTHQIARDFGAIFIKHPKNRGYGGAQKTGFIEALKRGADVAVLLHADGQYPPEDIPRMIKPIIDNECEAVSGSRILGGNVLRGGMPHYKYFGSLFLTSLENIFFGMGISEFHSGYRAYSRRVLENINFNLNSDKFIFDSEILLQIKEKKMKIKEVKIPTFYGAEVSYLDPIKYGLRILGIIIRYSLHKTRLVNLKQFE